MIKKVLVVDDYLPMLLALREGLETIGYEVTTASNGQVRYTNLRKRPI